MTFNTFFNTDFTTFNNNGIESFKTMLQSEGFKENRSDWFQCGSNSAIKPIKTIILPTGIICEHYANGNVKVV